MSGIMLCTMQSKKPYFIKEANKNIYSIEELSYYLYNYLYLVEEKFFNETLIDYIENALELKTIADGLKQATERKASLGEKISFVVKNANYYSAKEIDELERHLVMLNSKTSVERIKAKADILMGNRKYNMAITFYRNILNKGISNELSETFYGEVYNNLGVAYTKMFEYATAAACFRTAYKMSNNAVALESLIKADLLEGNDKKLKSDQDKFKISDEIINRCRTQIIGVKAHVDTMWKNIDKQEFISQCKRDYFVEINA